MPFTDDVTSPWSRNRPWLRDRAPANAGALNPPATDADIERLNTSLGFRVPRGLETWLRLNNGSTARDFRTPIPGGFQLFRHLDSPIFPAGMVCLDCGSSIDHHRQFLRIADDIGDTDYWNPSWIPVLAAADGHYGLLLDAGRADGNGMVLYYSETEYAKFHAASLGQVLNAVADALEGRHGGSVLTRGRHAHVQDGRVVWA
ncbi:SMI1/KNR4 family protein [Streptomyces sp. NPDC005122]